MRQTLIAAVTIATMLAAAATAAWQARDIGAQVGAAPVESGAVSGVVVTDTADSRPVRRAVVRLSGDGTTPRLIGTDNDGRFVFDQLPAGRFTVSASKAGFVSAFHGSTRPGRGPGVPVAVAANQKVDISIRILPGATISGVVRDGQGNPAPGVTVTAVESRAAGSVPAPMREVTDDRGMYRIFGLAPGEYLVAALPQLVAAPATRGGPGSGTVTPVTAADVQWAKAAGGVRTTGPPGAPSGPAEPARPVSYAPVFYPGTTNAAGAATIRVATGDDRTGVDMALQIAGLSRLGGTLVDERGAPVRIATVSLVPKRGDQPSPVDSLVAAGIITNPRAVVSASGFAFSGVVPGQYTLIARTGAGQRGAVSPEAATATLWSVIDVTVDSADRDDLALRLLPGLMIAGRYVFEPGSTPPVDVAALNLSFVATNPIPGVSSTYRASVQPDGTFRVPSLAPGNYLVRVDAALSTAAARWTLKSAVVNGVDLADRPLAAMADGRVLSGVVATFTARGTEIAGRLIDASGLPVTRYSIVVTTRDQSLWLPNSRRVRAVRPATDGSFSVRGLPAGDYAIAAADDIEDIDLSNPNFLSELLAAALPVSLAEGESKRQDLRVGR
jgi:hypothetical protein